MYSDRKRVDCHLPCPPRRLLTANEAQHASLDEAKPAAAEIQMNRPAQRCFLAGDAHVSTDIAIRIGWSLENEKILKGRVSGKFGTESRYDERMSPPILSATMNFRIRKFAFK